MPKNHQKSTQNRKTLVNEISRFGVAMLSDVKTAFMFPFRLNITFRSMILLKNALRVKITKKHRDRN